MVSNYHIPIILIFLIIINNLKSIQSATCKENQNLSNQDCFTDIITFDNERFRAGHSSLNKEGVFILEFSIDDELGNRVFYALKPNGRYYFHNESPTKEIVLGEKYHDGRKIIARYESINAFVALKNDVNKDKEFFLSISTYYCFMEIYNITNANIAYDSIYTYDYLGNQVFSFKFELLEAKYSGQVVYYLVFCHGNANQESGDQLSVKKISFSSLTFATSDIVATKTITGKLNDRTVTAFLIDDVDDDDFKILIAIYITNKYSFSVFKLSDLSKKCENKQLYGDVLSYNNRGPGYGLYFKILYLGNKDTAMIYFKNNNWDMQHAFFQVLTVVKDGSCNGFSNKIYMEINENLVTDLVLNDFINITNSR